LLFAMNELDGGMEVEPAPAGAGRPEDRCGIDIRAAAVNASRGLA
jgi:hypothetical protein